jgi:hypothetical protein
LSLILRLEARYQFPLISGPYFDSNTLPYSHVVAEWAALTQSFRGWTLTEIKQLSPRERKNWLQIAKYVKGKD